MNRNFYRLNRQRLISSLPYEKCMVVLSSGYEINRSADENYEFQVNNNFYYLTGIKQPNVHLIMLKENDRHVEILYIDEYSELYEKWMGHRLTYKEASDISGVYRSNVSYISNYEDDLLEFVDEYKVVCLDLETNRNVNHNSFGLALKDQLTVEKSEAEIKDIYENIVVLRTSKHKCEVEALQKAIDTTQKGIECLMENVEPGMYEYQLEAFFDFIIKTDGNKPTSFKTIAAGGINATTLHYSSNNTKLNDGDLVLFDLGCKCEGYCSDITRTFPVNGKFSPLQKKIYNIVLKANKTICKVAKAGMTLKQLQEICIDVLAEGCLKANLIKEKEEIKKYYFHGVSHTIGLDTHDPCLRNNPLPVNAVISNEPGLYFPEYNIGIRIEDDLLLKEDKAINLSKNIIKTVSAIEKFMKK